MSEVKETARPRFYSQPIQNKALSEQEGRPIFEPKTFVELKHPGDRSWSFIEEIDGEGKSFSLHNTPEGLVGEDYAARFPKEWEAFKRGEARAASGTPIEEWGMVPRSRAAELKAMNIFTVEEYADVQDNMLGKLGMGSRAAREKARTFLVASKAGANENALATQVAEPTEMEKRLQAGQVVQTPVTPAGAETVSAGEKSLEDCTDGELKDYIARETGERPKGNPSRDTLLKRAADVAQATAA